LLFRYDDESFYREIKASYLNQILGWSITPRTIGAAFYLETKFFEVFEHLKCMNVKPNSNGWFIGSLQEWIESVQSVKWSLGIEAENKDKYILFNFLANCGMFIQNFILFIFANFFVFFCEIPI
jgi:hypothetical protein